MTPASFIPIHSHATQMSFKFPFVMPQHVLDTETVLQLMNAFANQAIMVQTVIHANFLEFFPNVSV